MTDMATTIYQGHLDRVSDAFWTGDHAVTNGLMAYPHDMIYGDRRQRIETPEQMTRACEVARARLETLGATAYLRVCRAAEYDAADRDRIIGGHTTFILRGASYIVPPIASRMTLVREGERWLGAGIVSEIDPDDLQLLDPENSRPVDPTD